MLRNLPLLDLPTPQRIAPETNLAASPTDAIASYFLGVAKANSHLEARIGIPKETSEFLARNLSFLKPSRNSTGITILKDEAAITAAIRYPSGLNLVMCSEAFAGNFFLALRHLTLSTRDEKKQAKGVGWFSVPIIAMSDIVENNEIEEAYQDTTIGEVLLSDTPDVSRVFFPPDANTAVEALRRVYSSPGQIGYIIAPKNPVPVLDGDLIDGLFENGASVVSSCADADVQLVAIGAYQLKEALKAASRLADNNIGASVVVIIEPSRLREPRNDQERQFVIPDRVLNGLFPSGLPRVVVTHTRAELMTGVLRRIESGPARFRVLGHTDVDAETNVDNLLFADNCTWAHVVFSAAQVLGTDPGRFLTTDEMVAVLPRGGLHDGLARTCSCRN